MKKLSRAERRAQLLEVAQAIVREHGTDALTLGALAERAGVSKPIAYSHFDTRSGLMIALSKAIMERQIDDLAQVLAHTPASLDEVARVLAQQYMDCTTTIGPEWHAVSAALRGDAQMDAYQRETVRSHAAFYAEVLAPLSALPAATVRRRCVGILGAAEALSDEMVRGGCSREQAADDLAGLVVDWLRPAARVN